MSQSCYSVCEASLSTTKSCLVWIDKQQTGMSCPQTTASGSNTLNCFSLSQKIRKKLVFYIDNDMYFRGSMSSRFWYIPIVACLLVLADRIFCRVWIMLRFFVASATITCLLTDVQDTTANGAYCLGCLRIICCGVNLGGDPGRGICLCSIKNKYT